MSLKYKKGDICQALRNGEITYLAHGVNCRGIMGAGIAFQIKNEFEGLYKKYQTYCFERNHDVLGDCLRVGSIFNLFIQDTYGRTGKHVNYGALAHSLLTAFRYIVDNREGGEVFGMPRIGCGLAGGDWSIVSEIVSYYSELFDIPVVVYDL